MDCPLPHLHKLCSEHTSINDIAIKESTSLQAVKPKVESRPKPKSKKEQTSVLPHPYTHPTLPKPSLSQPRNPTPIQKRHAGYKASRCAPAVAVAVAVPFFILSYRSRAKNNPKHQHQHQHPKSQKVKTYPRTKEETFQSYIPIPIPSRSLR
jgi:hypothetical protein